MIHDIHKDPLLASIPDFPNDGDEVAEKEWLGNQVNHMFAHCTKVAQAGIPIGILTLAVLPQEKPLIAIPGKTELPENAQPMVISIEAPVITLAQKIFEMRAQHQEVDEEGLQCVLLTLAQVKIGLERVHEVIERLQHKLRPAGDVPEPFKADAEPTVIPEPSAAAAAEGEQAG